MEQRLKFQKPEKPIRDPRARAQYRKSHGRCEACGKRPSAEVHHIRSRQLSGSDDESNLLSLCTSCHRGWTGVDKTRREWLEEHQRTMSDEAQAKVRRALRLEDADG